VIEVRAFTTAEAGNDMLARIRALLEDAFEDGFSSDDWAHTIGGHHVTVSEAARLVAHAAVVPRTIYIGDEALNAGYVEGVATTPDRQRRGLGSRVMSELATTIRSLYAIGVLSTDRSSFYERLGWERWRGPSYVRSGGNLLRTADEDEGLLVLRFGASAGIPLDQAIACDSRTGDDW
jgi:aminoglycoside 2'-N-acetyltransferase I